MARIAGVDLNNKKRIDVALTAIFGIGMSSSREILRKTGIEANNKVSDLSEAEIRKLREVIESDYTVEGSLRQEIQFNIKRLMDLGTYKGLRHRRGLPVRGQRTHTNARTRKGKKARIGGKR